MSRGRNNNFLFSQKPRDKKIEGIFRLDEKRTEINRKYLEREPEREYER
jgi:hypothetical protein